MDWFKRLKEGILTPTKEKKETPEGLWYNCPGCKHVLFAEEHALSLWVCPSCNYHERIGSEEYFALLFDGKGYSLLFDNLMASDPLGFSDTKKYTRRIADSVKKSGHNEAISVAEGDLSGMRVVIGAMDFNFIGGSMGSVMGEKIARAIQFCIAHRYPIIIISKSGGARMMESAFSLMQMARTASMLTRLSREKIPYISVLTDPTTGGVTASFGMLGDMNIAEPGALIGFAGPRVVRETIGKDLPTGFQTAEFVLEHGFLDFIVNRKDLKEKITIALNLLMNG